MNSQSTLDKNLKDLSLETSETDPKGELESLLNVCIVPRFVKGDERPAVEQDFSSFQISVEKKICAVKVFLENAFWKSEIENVNEGCKVSNNDCLCIKNILVKLIILLGENNSKFPWNTENSVDCCAQIRNSITEAYGSKCISELLARQSLVKPLLLALRPKLQAGEWKHYPAAVMCYRWLLQNIVQPHLGQYLADVAPTALLLVDDFVEENRIIGIHSIHHIIQNTTAAELKFYGHGAVMLKALEPILLVRDAPLVTDLLPCIVSLVAKLETDLGDKDNHLKWSHFDNMLEVVLQNMELEHVIALREAYIKHFELLIQSAGVRVIRWSRRILRVFKEYIDVAINHSDFNSILACMKAMACYLKVSSSVSHLYANTVLFMLLKTLYFLTKPNSTNIDARDQAVLCLTAILQQMQDTEKQRLKTEINERLKKKAGAKGQTREPTETEDILHEKNTCQ